MGAFLGRREIRAHAFPEPVIPPFPGTNIYGQAGVSATPDSALQVPTVWACVMLIANAVSMLPLQTFRKSSGVPTRVSDPMLVTSPAPGMTRPEWLHMLMVSLLLRGKVYGRVLARDNHQRITQVKILNPDLLHVRQGTDGLMTYQLVDGSKTTTLNPSDVWQLHGLRLPGMDVGLSPISYAAATLGIDLSSRRFASDYFAGGGIPKAVLTSDQKIDQDQARTLKERMLAATRQREPMVLGNGTTYQQIQVSPEESQFLATQQANVAQIARYFGVPPEMVGGSGGNSMTYANVEQRQLDFLTLAVTFWLVRVEEAISKLLPDSIYVSFDASALLRVDAHTQSEVDVLHVAAKVMTRDEIRARMNLAPLTEEQLASLGDMPDMTVSPTGRPIKSPAPVPASTPPAPSSDQQGASNAP